MENSKPYRQVEIKWAEVWESIQPITEVKESTDNIFLSLVEERLADHRSNSSRSISTKTQAVLTAPTWLSRSFTTSNSTCCSKAQALSSRRTATCRRRTATHLKQHINKWAKTSKSLWCSKFKDRNSQRNPDMCNRCKIWKILVRAFQVVQVLKHWILDKIWIWVCNSYRVRAKEVGINAILALGRNDSDITFPNSIASLKIG